jgi:protein-tyrosine-phosphatase
MAEGFLKNFFDKKSSNHIKIFSCGVASNARDGMLISLDAKMAMKEIGINLPEDSMSIDIKKHPELLKDVDLILTMTEQHKNEIMQIEEAKNKEIYTLKEFAGESGDIDDPSMKNIEGFRIARDHIRDCLVKALQKYDL